MSLSGKWEATMKQGNCHEDQLDSFCQQLVDAGTLTPTGSKELKTFIIGDIENVTLDIMKQEAFSFFKQLFEARITALGDETADNDIDGNKSQESEDDPAVLSFAAYARRRRAKGILERLPDALS